MNVRDTQRIMDLDVELLRIQTLFVNFISELLRDVFVQFRLNKAWDSCFDASVDLRFDFTGVINQYANTSTGQRLLCAVRY
jgi:hypothetical protein